MAKLHHIRQLAVVSEGVAGTEEVSHTEVDLIRVRELTLTQTPQYFERPVHTTSFGYVPRRQENTMCELSFAVEIAGHTDNAGSFASPTAPLWGRLLEACGFAQAAVNFVGVASGTVTGGPILHADSIAATGTGLAVGDYYSQGAEFDIPVISAAGTFAGAATCTPSGATFTVGSNDGTTQNGYAWYPNTESTKTVSIRLYNDGDLIRVYGCRGDVTIDCQSQDVALLRFTMMGIYSTTSTTGLLDDTLTGAYPEATPPTFVSSSLALTSTDGSGNLGSADINFTECQFTMGNNVVMRQNSNSSSGWLAAHIANRTPNGTFNPDDPGTGTFNYRAKLFQSKRYQMETTWGTTVGNTFKVLAANVEFDSIDDGERDEVQSLTMPFRITRGFESGADANTVGNDNELILFNF